MKTFCVNHKNHNGWAAQPHMEQPLFPVQVFDAHLTQYLLFRKDRIVEGYMPKMSYEGLVGTVLALIIVVLDQAGIKNPWVLWGAFILAAGLCLDAVIRSGWKTRGKVFGTLAVSAAFLAFGFYLMRPLSPREESKSQESPQAASPNPSFPFIFGAPFGDNNSPTWKMLVKHYGPDTIYNCDLDFYDNDRKNIENLWLSHHPDVSFPPPKLAGGDSQLNLHIPEVDPIGKPVNFDWTPLNRDGQHYTVSILCRGDDAQFAEEWEINRINGLLRTNITVTRTALALERHPERQREVFSCIDPKFSSAPLVSKMPDTWPPKPVNLGYKRNHNFYVPTIILDPNDNLELVMVKDIPLFGCWGILKVNYDQHSMRPSQ